MQSQGGSQRGFPRRPAGEPGPPPNVPIRSISPGTQGRPSTGSSRSVPSSSGGSTKRMTRESSSSNMPLSQIEKSVTHLLVATKQLLETLTQWSRGQATDSQVSDVYVRLGYEFNMACRAFSAINVDISDLGNVPDLLRHILEATLSQEASSENLEKYLPRIRDIIINLLHGLKRKQQKLRQKQYRDRDGNPIPERSSSIGNVESSNTGLTNLLEEGLENGYKPDISRSESVPQAQRNPSPTRRFASQKDVSTSSNGSASITQNAPVLPPYPSEEAGLGKGEIDVDAFPPPPPPPPDNQSSALAALQKGGDLERRASRRYSQYQISKHLGGAANGVPILPQNGPVPNRGKREDRESLRAVQKRESVRSSRHIASQQRSAAQEISPSRVPARVPEEPQAKPQEENTTPAAAPPAQSPQDQYAPSATLAGPPQDAPSFLDGTEPEPATPSTPKQAPLPATEKSLPAPPPRDPKPNESYFQVSPPPTPTQDLTLFLQYKTKVKKFVLPEGRDELTIGRLQLAFIEKFSWSTQQNGSDLPEIYIQDPVSGVRHELEDLSDVKDRTVLVLNVEPLDEVKRHIDDGIQALTKIVQEVKQNVDDQSTALQQVSDRQQATSKEFSSFIANPPVAPQTTEGARISPSSSGRRLNPGQVGELQSLRRDLAVMRQTYSSFQSEIQTSMSSLRQKAAQVKTVAAKAATPEMEGDAGYAYVSSGRKQMNTDSDHLVGKVDDLQDLVEDLRKDVVHRGVRPLPRQLENVSLEISGLAKELKRMEGYLGQEKPIWTKIWEKELEDVCQGRDELRLMEELLVDLRDDLEKASETFVLVEQATKEQMKDDGTGASAGNARLFSRGLENLGNSLDQSAAKEDVLGEVRALQPNHENRLEAIERAEKLRQRELAGRRDNALHQEIKSYVKDGKLKKSGGFEEVERARQMKDDRIRREVWERMNGPLEEEEDDDVEYEEVDEDELAAEETEEYLPAEEQIVDSDHDGTKDVKKDG